MPLSGVSLKRIGLMRRGIPSPPEGRGSPAHVFMKLLKRTYALPPKTLEQFEQSVSPGKRSAVIAQLIAEWLAEQEREALRRDIAEGCADMWDVYLETEREFNPIDEELHRAVEP